MPVDHRFQLVSRGQVKRATTRVDQHSGRDVLEACDGKGVGGRVDQYRRTRVGRE